MTNSKLIATVFLVIFHVYAVSCQTEDMCKDSDLRQRDLQDSRVELVKIRQETGFDGKVRSIKFGIDSNDTKSSNDSTTKIDLSDTNEVTTQETPSLTRKRRSTNDLEDLEADEAKVFRPLFVYRSQVNKRMRFKNNDNNNNNGRSRVVQETSQRGKSSSHRYYHPYRYSPYRYYPSG